VNSSLAGRLRAAFRWSDPDPDGTHLVSDRSGWWRDAALLAELGPALAALHPRPTVVVAPEVTGFLLGPLVAAALGVGFVEAYRPRPVPEPMSWGTAEAGHRGRPVTLGVRARHLSAAERVLVVNDWAATGAQVRAVYAALAALGATPVGAAVVVDECPPEVAAELRIRGLLTGPDLDG
jgi:adenine phosphoribosyltransferase